MKYSINSTICFKFLPLKFAKQHSTQTETNQPVTPTLGQSRENPFPSPKALECIRSLVSFQVPDPLSLNTKTRLLLRHYKRMEFLTLLPATPMER
jgi:hypothetical protein